MLPDMNGVQIAGHPAFPTEAPSSFFYRLGLGVANRRRLVLTLFAVALVLAGGLGFQLFGSLKSQGFNDPGSQSVHADNILSERFGVSEPAAAMVVSATAGVDAPETGAAARALVASIAARPGVANVTSYWTSGRPAALLGKGGHDGEVLAYARQGVDVDTLGSTLARAYNGAFSAAGGEVHVAVGGTGVIDKAVNSHITADLGRAESIAVPVTIVLLLFVFGSLVSAGLPFSVAVGSIVGSFFLLWLITLATDVSVFALNLITGLGLGLGIDYSLLIVNRFREELRTDPDVERAVARTVATAGRTVVLSGLTVCIVMVSLTFFPQYFLKSFGYAGILTTGLAALSAVTALPAVLAALGSRVDRITVLRRDLTPRQEGAWSRTAAAVMRHPWPVLVAGLVFMGVLASPALSARFGTVDYRSLPASDPAVAVSNTLADDFPGQSASPVGVVLLHPGSLPAVDAYAMRLDHIPGVTQVSTPTEVISGGRVEGANPDPRAWLSGALQRIQVLATQTPTTSAGMHLVADVRAVASPGPRLVGGQAADFTDSQHAISQRGLLAVLWIAAATMVMLFLFTGSLVLPLKAVLLNVATLGATLGVLIWIFKDGHLQWLVGHFTVTGSIDTTTAVLVCVVAFALSMDYEMFLLSRIKEEHDAGRDTASAVTTGLQRSGRIITAAAILIAIVFATFVSSGVTNIKELGVGVAFAILVDATVVRGLLVPAFMRLAGQWNWWAPRPLADLYTRFGLSDGPARPASDGAVPQASGNRVSRT
jgi:putative drug exporter of the RND superfamily